MATFGMSLLGAAGKTLMTTGLGQAAAGAVTEAGKSLLSQGQGGGKGQGRGQKGGGQKGGQRGGQQGGKGTGCQSGEDTSLGRLVQMLLEQRQADSCAIEDSSEDSSTPQLIDITPQALPESKPVSVDAVAFTVPAAPKVVETSALVTVLRQHISSFTNGRMRFRHASLQHRDKNADFSRCILGIEGIDSVESRVTTGSVLILYDAKRYSQDQFLEAMLPAFAQLA